MHSVPKYSDTLLKSGSKMLQDFESVSDYFGTLCIKGLNAKFRNLTSVEHHYNFFAWNGGKISISNFLKKK